MSVKSTERTVRILEYFDEMQASLTALDVSKALNYPKSSCWGILKTLADLGYLAFEAESRTYLPTERVSLLGAWAYAPLFGEGRLLDLMKDLHGQTGARIVLAAQAGHLVRYIHIVEGQNPKIHHRDSKILQPRGAPLPMLKTAIGRLYLSLYQKEEAARLIRRLNAERAKGDLAISLDDTLKDLEEIRRQGYSISVGRKTPGSGTIAMFLPRACGRGWHLALGITNNGDVIQKMQSDLINQLRAAIERHLGDLISL